MDLLLVRARQRRVQEAEERVVPRNSGSEVRVDWQPREMLL